jgi:CheY-like chemotaxis protein
MPRGETVTTIANDAAARPTSQTVEIRKSIPDARQVLLVEDEALIGMMMVDILSELGYSVIGPITNVSEASTAAKSGNFEYAVLDINLKGELVYPVADLLIKAGVPFVFVTGYSAERIDKRYSVVPTLQKPLQKKDLQNAFARVKPGLTGLASA